MAITFNPISFRSSNINHAKRKDNNNTQNTVINKQNAKELFADKKLRNTFLAGTIAGIMVTAGVSGQYNKVATRNMLKDMKENLDNNDYDEIEIKDVTKDNTPEIILKDKNGDADVYDVKSHKIYVKLGDELIEKMD